MRVEVGRIVGDGGGEGAADSEGQEHKSIHTILHVSRSVVPSPLFRGD